MNFLALTVVGLFYFGKRNIWNFLMIFVLLAIAGLALYQSALDIGTVDGEWWSSTWQNFATEMVGAILTFAFFEILINANNRQEELVRQMASADNAMAINAVNELHALGYLYDGTLRRKIYRNNSLSGANLSGADLAKSIWMQSNLSGTNFRNANLEKAVFSKCNWVGAKLDDTNLSGAKLTQQDLSGMSLRLTNFKKADLSGSNLANVDLFEVNLCGANLANVNLTGAHLYRVEYDTQTILPDTSYADEFAREGDELIYWTPNTDMTRYTNPKHPDFWQPNWVNQLSEVTRPQSHPYRALRAKRRR